MSCLLYKKHGLHLTVCFSASLALIWALIISLWMPISLFLSVMAYIEEEEQSHKTCFSLTPPCLSQLHPHRFQLQFLLA